MEPELLVADEPNRILRRIHSGTDREFVPASAEGTRVFVSVIAHDLSMVRFCVTGWVVMHDGKLVEVGNVEDIFQTSEAPIYERLLIESIPIPDPHREAAKSKRERT